MGFSHFDSKTGESKQIRQSDELSTPQKIVMPWQQFLAMKDNKALHERGIKGFDPEGRFFNGFQNVLFASPEFIEEFKIIVHELAAAIKKMNDKGRSFSDLLSALYDDQEADDYVGALEVAAQPNQQEMQDAKHVLLLAKKYYFKCIEYAKSEFLAADGRIKDGVMSDLFGQKSGEFEPSDLIRSFCENAFQVVSDYQEEFARSEAQIVEEDFAFYKKINEAIDVYSMPEITDTIFNYIIEKASTKSNPAMPNEMQLFLHFTNNRVFDFNKEFADIEKNHADKLEQIQAKKKVILQSYQRSFGMPFPDAKERSQAAKLLFADLAETPTFETIYAATKDNKMSIKAFLQSKCKPEAQVVRQKYESYKQNILDFGVQTAIAAIQRPNGNEEYFTVNIKKILTGEIRDAESWENPPFLCALMKPENSVASNRSVVAKNPMSPWKKAALISLGILAAVTFLAACVFSAGLVFGAVVGMGAIAGGINLLTAGTVVLSGATAAAASGTGAVVVAGIATGAVGIVSAIGVAGVVETYDPEALSRFRKSKTEKPRQDKPSFIPNVEPSKALSLSPTLTTRSTTRRNSISTSSFLSEDSPQHRASPIPKRERANSLDSEKALLSYSTFKQPNSKPLTSHDAAIVDKLSPATIPRRNSI